MSAKKRKRYIVTTNSETFACSLVTNPAIEEQFVSFSEQEKVVEKFSDEKKHMICGVVAVPNRPIYRVGENGEEYDIVFSAEAIEKMANDYLRNYRNNEVTLQHQENAEGVYLVEQWIKTDMVYDKSIAMGLSKELPVGSWFQTYYVDSNEIWQRIESGELLGFSLECMLGLEEFNKIENKDNMVEFNEMSFWSKMKETLMEVFTSTQSKEELAAGSGMTVSEFEKESEIIQQELKEIFNAEEPTQTVTEEPTADAKADSTDKGVTETVEEPVVEEPVVEEPTVTEEPVKEEEKDIPVADAKADSTDNGVEEAQPNPYEELLKNLNAEIEALKKMNEGLVQKVNDLGRKPSVEPIKTNASNSGGNGDTYSQWRDVMEKYYNG